MPKHELIVVMFSQPQAGASGYVVHRSFSLVTYIYLVVQERRTRISEKLRKLQDLVPNMDKV